MLTEDNPNTHIKTYKQYELTGLSKFYETPQKKQVVNLGSCLTMTMPSNGQTTPTRLQKLDKQFVLINK